MSTEDYSTMPKKPILKFEMATEGRKRLADTPLDGRNVKKQKMNQYIKLRCCSVLNDRDVKCTWESHASHPCVDSDDSVQMSPEKALRAAMLKRRFSDTIFKATHRGNPLDNDVNAPLSTKKMKNGLMQQREKERAAARMALEKMEKTVDINDNFKVMREFEELICHGLSSEDGLARNSTGKEYSSFDTAAAILDAEEGEIL